MIDDPLVLAMVDALAESADDSAAHAALVDRLLDLDLVGEAERVRALHLGRVWDAGEAAAREDSRHGADTERPAGEWWDELVRVKATTHIWEDVTGSKPLSESEEYALVGTLAWKLVGRVYGAGAAYGAHEAALEARLGEWYDPDAEERNWDMEASYE